MRTRNWPDRAVRKSPASLERPSTRPQRRKSSRKKIATPSTGTPKRPPARVHRHHGYDKADTGRPPQRQEGAASSDETQDYFAHAQGDPNGAGQAGRGSRRTQALRRLGAQDAG